MWTAATQSRLSQSVVLRFIASSRAKLFLLAAVLAGSASLAVWLKQAMTLQRALGIVVAVDLGATLLLVAFIRSGNVGAQASGASEHLLQRAGTAGGGASRGQALAAAADGLEGGGLAALLESALIKVLRPEAGAAAGDPERGGLQNLH